MTAKVFNVAIDILLLSEGGYQCLKNDRGNWTSGKIGIGELKGTKYGISAMCYPKEDIENLTLEQAKEIYRRDYWDKCKCDFLPDYLSVAVFDYAVNSGIKQAIKDLQKSLGVIIDGIIGNQTIGAANSKPQRKILENYIEARLNFLMSLKNWKIYGNGWGRRVDRVIEVCEKLI